MTTGVLAAQIAQNLATRTIPKCRTIRAMTPAQLQAFRIVQGIAPKYSFAHSAKEWDFKEFLMQMTSQYHTDVGTYDSAEGLDALVEEFEMSLVSLYDHPHDSDECCSVEFLLVKGVPLIGWKKVGDKSDYSDGFVVFNDDEGRNLAKRVWQLVHNTDAIGDDTLDVLKWVFDENQYIQGVGNVREDLVAYAINSPRWMLGRGLDLNDHKLYAINPDNSLAPVARVVSTAMSPDRYGSNAYHRTTVELEDGTQREVETEMIVHTPRRAPA